VDAAVHTRAIHGLLHTGTIHSVTIHIGTFTPAPFTPAPFTPPSSTPPHAPPDEERIRFRFAMNGARRAVWHLALISCFGGWWLVISVYHGDPPIRRLWRLYYKHDLLQTFRIEQAVDLP
jgi:hypothetical protein